MPQTALFIGQAIFSAIGASSIGSLTIAGTTLAEIVGTVAIATGLQALSSALMGGGGMTPESQKANLRQAVAPRRKYYGTVKIGGVFAFRKDKDGFLYLLVMLGEGEFSAFVEHWLDDVLVTLDGTNAVNEDQFENRGVKRVHIYPQVGTAAQTAHAAMVSAWSGVWTSAHRLRGIANALIICQTVKTEYFSAVYPQGIPQYKAVVDTAKCWDPTDGAQDPDDPDTWTFTQNAARVMLDHGWAEYGRRIPRSMFEVALDDWRDKIFACDQAMALAEGGTEPRFQLAGGYGFDEPAKQVARKMEDATGARLRMRGDGGVVLDLAVWQEPRVRLTDDHILGYSGLRQGLEAGDTFNEVRAQYLAPDNGYQVQEAQPWRDEGSIASFGLQSTTLDLSWCPSHRQARARQQLEAARSNPPWVGTITTNAYGLNVLGERIIAVEISDLGLDLTCEVMGWRYNAANATCLIDIRSISEAAFNLSTAAQGTAPVADETPAAAAITAPTITVTAQLNDFGADSIAATMAVDAVVPARDDLTFYAEWRIHDAGVTDDDATWSRFSVADGAYRGVSASVLVPETYDVRAKFIASSGRESAWTYERSIIISNNGEYLVTGDGSRLVMAPGVYWAG